MRPAAVGSTPQEYMERFIRWLLLKQSARGGEIRVLSSAVHSRRCWQDVATKWFEWVTTLSVAWRREGDHINLCEARARLLGVKVRSRDAMSHGEKYIALMDSQVNLSHAAKGRGGSMRMAHVERQITAHQLAAHLREIAGYCRSDQNPADKGSRDKESWSRTRSLRVRNDKLTAASRAEGRQTP